MDDSTIFQICSKGSASVLQQSANIVTRLTKCLCFCKDSSHASNFTNIVVNNKPVDRVTQTKLLGVRISSDLTLNAHEDYIVGKASKRLHMLYQLKRAGIEQTDLLKIYLSVIRPVLEYACQTPVNPGLSTGAIVGIAVGAVVLLVVIIVIIVVLVCNCKEKNKVSSEPELGSGRQSRRRPQEDEVPLQER